MNGKWLRGALIVTRARIIEIGVDRPKQSTRTHAGSDKDAISKTKKTQIHGSETRRRMIMRIIELHFWQVTPS